MSPKTSTHIQSMRCNPSSAGCGQRTSGQIILFLAILSLACASLFAQSKESAREEAGKNDSNLNVWRATIDFGQTLLKDCPPDELMEFELAEIPDTVISNMDSTLGWVLQDSAHPHERARPIRARADADLTVQMRAANMTSVNDLVEYRWTNQGRPLRVVASRNALKLDFRLDVIPECSRSTGTLCVDAAKAWVEETIRLQDSYTMLNRRIEYSVALPWPEELSDGLQFSSAPDEDIMRLPGMYRWYHRVDAFVEDGTLSILIYKKVGQLQGYQDGSDWFPDEFSAEVHERARQLGKLPATGDDDSDK